MIKKEIQIFFAALRFYTRIPCPRWVEHSQEYLNESSRYFPFIGWIVGAVAAVTFHAALLLFSIPISIILSMIAAILTTGAFHEDGFADTCDGFGGGWTKEQILDIMKDSRIGAYGTIGLIMILLLKFLLLSEVPVSYMTAVLVAGHSLSRFAATTVQYRYRYARDNDDSKAKPMARKITLRNLFIAAVFGIFPILLLGHAYGFLLILPVLSAAYLLAQYSQRRIGGYTGDSLGATQQVCEVIFYLSALILLKL